MELTVKPVTRKLKEYPAVAHLMKTAFPKDELISLTFWRMLTLRRGIDFSAFYDGETLIGVCYTAELGDYIYVPFLAICEEQRNRGYGGRILSRLKEHFEKTLVLHIEPLDPTAGNYAQRVKRDAFYRRNGIEDTGYRFRFFGVNYAVYASDSGDFDIFKHKKLMEWFSFHLVRFHFKKRGDEELL